MGDLAISLFACKYEELSEFQGSKCSCWHLKDHFFWVDLRMCSCTHWWLLNSPRHGEAPIQGRCWGSPDWFSVPVSSSAQTPKSRYPHTQHPFGCWFRGVALGKRRWVVPAWAPGGREWGYREPWHSSCEQPLSLGSRSFAQCLNISFCFILGQKLVFDSQWRGEAGEAYFRVSPRKWSYYSPEAFPTTARRKELLRGDDSV